MAGEKKKIDRLFDQIERSGFDSLTEAEKFIFSIFWLFRETNNGGFHTFFFNDAGHLAVYALKGLEAIGAVGTVGILRRAITVFPQGKVPFDQELRRSVLMALPNELQGQFLGQLTTEFFGNTENVADLVERYVAANLDRFPAFSERRQ